MGSQFSCRRRAGTEAQIRLPQEYLENDEDWDLVQQADLVLTRKFRAAVKKIINMLALRRIWSRVGRWLGSEASVNNKIRPILSQFWIKTRHSRIEKYSELFSHLQRRGGKLVYK